VSHYAHVTSCPEELALGISKYCPALKAFVGKVIFIEQCIAQCLLYLLGYAAYAQLDASFDQQTLLLFRFPGLNGYVFGGDMSSIFLLKLDGDVIAFLGIGTSDMLCGAEDGQHDPSASILLVLTRFQQIRHLARQSPRPCCIGQLCQLSQSCE
jgi:hypothetical protein